MTSLKKVERKHRSNLPLAGKQELPILRLMIMNPYKPQVEFPVLAMSGSAGG